jgi:hypothetical protein
MRLDRDGANNGMATTRDLRDQGIIIIGLVTRKGRVRPDVMMRIDNRQSRVDRHLPHLRAPSISIHISASSRFLRPGRYQTPRRFVERIRNRIESRAKSQRSLKVGTAQHVSATNAGRAGYTGLSGVATHRQMLEIYAETAGNSRTMAKIFIPACWNPRQPSHRFAAWHLQRTMDTMLAAHPGAPPYETQAGDWHDNGLMDGEITHECYNQRRRAYPAAVKKRRPQPF